MREKDYLKQRYGAILSYTGAILALSGVLMLTPLLLLFFYPEEVKNLWAFGAPAALLFLIGLSMRRLFRPAPSITLTTQEGGVIVFFSWAIVMIASARPFMATLNMDFTTALFEAVSGWTTTGLSVIDMTQAAKTILIWRSTMQLAGGAGFAIIMMSAIIGPTGVGLSTAEGRSNQLAPHVRQSARLVLMIYGGYVVAGILAYVMVGMSVFDAVNHAFTAVSTGGFSTHPQSLGYWDSVTIEAVSLPLMLFGNLSFVTAWLLWRGKFKFVARNGEIQTFTFLIPFSTASLFLITCRGLYPHIGKAFRTAVFEAVSALTTTGFSTTHYGDWNSFGTAVLIVLMLIGGGTCSTAGGIKQFRVYMLWRLLVWELKRPFLPRTAVIERSIWEAKRKVFVNDTQFHQISVFIFLYIATFAVGALILCACGYSIHDSLFEFASALGTVGLSVGVTSANAPRTVLWAETVAMFLGRLEFIVVIISILKIGKDLKPILSKSN